MGRSFRLILLGVIGVVSAAPGVAAGATVDVTTNIDMPTMGCTLREAVTVTNSNSAGATGCTLVPAPGADMITLHAATTYKLTITSTNEPSNVDGDLDVDTTMGTSGLTIQGAGAGTTTIEAATAADRAIELVNGAMTLRGVTVTGGFAPPLNDYGGGILIDSSGNLTVDQSIVSGNDANSGGGISASGPLTVTDSTISMNGTLGAAGTQYGGGINAAGTGLVSLTGTIMSGNKAIRDGGAINATSGSLTVESSVISNNVVTSPDYGDSSQPRGGGIFSNNVTPVMITDSTIASNSVTTDDVADPKPGLSGGGFHHENGVATIIGTLFSGNSVVAGDNRHGGGIFNAGTLDLRNSTLVSNTAAGGNGGALNTGFTQAKATLVNVTLSGNSAAFGSAIYNSDSDAGLMDFTKLHGTLVANGAAACFNADVNPIISDGYNVDEGTSCGLTLTGMGDVQNAAPGLLSLAANGGPTNTQAITTASAALNRVPLAQCLDENAAPLTVDQRGQPRPSPPGGACDSGAFERQPDPVVPPVVAQPTPDATPKKTCKRGFRLRKVKGKRRCVRRKKKQ